MLNSDSNIKFSDLMYQFVSKIWIMILVAVIVGGSIFAYQYYTYEPMYASTATMYILRQSENEERPDYSSDFNVAATVVNDCKELLTTHKVLDKVIEKNNLPYTYEELCNMITIENEQNSRLLKITVKSTSPAQSQLIVDSVCAEGEIAIDERMGYDQISTHDVGTLEKVPCNSQFSYTFILGAIAAFILTYIVIILIYIFDERISDPEIAENVLELPVLALIPNMKSNKNLKGVYQGKTATQRHRYYVQNWKENR